MSGWTPWRRERPRGEPVIRPMTGYDREMVGKYAEAQPAAPVIDTVDPDLPPEPPFGIYTCASDKCGYLYVHDADGWFYVYDFESYREPLKWGLSARTTWADFQEEGGDCTSRPLRPVRPSR